MILCSRIHPEHHTMHTLRKLTLLAATLFAAAGANAEMVKGHFRSNGTYVAPYYRTPANGTPYDNLSHRGYPSQEPGYVSPRSYGLESSHRQSLSDLFDGDSFQEPSRLPSLDSFDGGLQTLPNTPRSERTGTLFAF